jgi:hypothetical protein
MFLMYIGKIGLNNPAAQEVKLNIPVITESHWSLGV